MRIGALCLILVVTSTSLAFPCAFSVPPPPFETYLIPVTPTEVSGAFGTNWTSEFWIYNGSPRTLASRGRTAERPDPDVFPIVEPGCPNCEIQFIRPGEARRLETFLVKPGPPNEGRFFHLLQDVAPAVWMSLHVRDLSRQSGDWGVEVPIVPLREMKTSTFQLLNVPLRPGFRVRLRVYGEDNPSGRPRARMRVYPMDGAEPVAQRDLHLVYTTATPQMGLPCTWVPIVPTEAVVPEVSALVQEPITARIEIEPLTTTNRYWAMITVTNNETQHVTLITPQ